jgi:predicted outer membrane repeat protein
MASHLERLCLDNKSDTFQGNTAQGNGGAVYVWPGSSLMADNNSFSQNSASLQGGGIHSQGNLMLGGCTFNNNSAFEGGAVRSDASGLSATNCTFAANSAAIGGAYSIAGFCQ